MEFNKKKVVILGDIGSGKTSLAKVLSGQDFPLNPMPTLGADVEIGKICCAYWDCTDDIDENLVSYWTGAEMFIYIADLSRPNFQDSFTSWQERVNEHFRRNDDYPPHSVFCATKTDLVEDKTTIKNPFFMHKTGYTSYIPVSAKTGGEH